MDILNDKRVWIACFVGIVGIVGYYLYSLRTELNQLKMLLSVQLRYHREMDHPVSESESSDDMDVDRDLDVALAEDDDLE